MTLPSPPHHHHHHPPSKTFSVLSRISMEAILVVLRLLLEGALNLSVVLKGDH